MNKILVIILLLSFSITVYGQQTDQDNQEDKENTTEPVDTIGLDDIELDDIDLEDAEEDKLSKESSFPWNKFAVGGQIGNLQFGDQTAISAAPEIVYNVNDALQFGVDGVFEYYKVKRAYNYYTGRYENVDYKENNSAGRFFSRFVPVKTFPIFAQLEYERANQQNVYGNYSDNNTGQTIYPSVKQKLNNFNGGLGFYNGPYYIGLMYNFNNRSNKDDFLDLAAKDLTNRNPEGNNKVYTAQDIKDFFRADEYYTNALTFRTGINIPLGRGDKNKKRKKKKKEKAPDAFR